MKVVEIDDYLQITLPELWNLDDFVSWCGSCEKLKGDKVKILDHMKKWLEKTADNNLIEEDIRQKAKDLKMKFKVMYYVWIAYVGDRIVYIMKWLFVVSVATNLKR